MPSAQRPANEAERLAALRSLPIEPIAEGWFDQIALYAAERTGACLALVSFLDEDKEWFKAHTGACVPEIPRSQSFCAHAVGGGWPLWVEDMSQDPRFADNPYVTGAPGLRSYACALIAPTADLAVGAVSVFDRQARPFDIDTVRLLRDLAGVVSSELRDRRLGRRRKSC
jgi:diguanylate cyclase